MRALVNPGVKTLVSHEGGRLPTWSANGRELFFLNGPSLIVVPVSKSPATTPTEVVVVASEMIRVVDLNPFDLSMWYRRAR